MEYQYRCDTCKTVYVTEAAGDRLTSCRNEDCDGIPKRDWQVTHFNTANLRQARESK